VNAVAGPANLGATRAAVSVDELSARKRVRNSDRRTPDRRSPASGRESLKPYIMEVPDMKWFLAISIATVIFFVVVCPLTPTPVAVVSGKLHSHQTHAATPVLLLLAAASAPTLLVVCYVRDRFEPTVSAKVLELTCARLC
jgi:hypothetical protein